MINVEEGDHKPTRMPGLKFNPFVFRPKRIVFYAVFFLLYFLSGALMIADIGYRPIFVGLLIVPLILVYGVKIDLVFLAFAALVAVSAISAFVNDVSISDFMLFLRIPLFAYLAYYLVDRFVSSKNIIHIIKLVVLVGVIQLPVVILQYLLYDQIPPPLKDYEGRQITYTDIGFGTFRVGDSAMNLFLVLVVVYLLYDRKHNYFVRYRLPILICLTTTILIGNSNMAKITLVLVWGVYFASHLNYKSTISLIVLMTLMGAALLASGRLNHAIGELTYRLTANWSQFVLGQEDLYLSGKSARGAALYYYASNEILWLGDGPSQSVNPITRERLIGNFGHIFVFYSEVGLIGWLISVLIFLLIAIRPHNGWARITAFTMMLFVSTQMMGFTNNIMNDLSVFFIYCILAKTYLIPPAPAPLRKPPAVNSLIAQEGAALA